MPPISRRFLSAGSALAISALLAAAPMRAEDGLAGAYLAARHANFDGDFRNSAAYLTQALVLDPDNPNLMENAVMAYMALGQFANALPIARRLEEVDAGRQVARLALLAEKLHDKAYGDALTAVEAGINVGTLVDGLVGAWAELGEGRMSEALTAFDTVATAPGVEAFGLYHKGLALASVGDFEGADRVFGGGDGSKGLRLTRRGTLAYAEVLSQLERNADAIALIDEGFGASADPRASELRARLEAGETVPFDIVRDPLDGQAEVFVSVANALNGEAEDSYTLLYARVAEYLRPDHADAVLLSADLLERLKQYDLATETYDRIGRDDPAFYSAEIGRAEALYSAGKPEAAIEAMRQLAHALPDLLLVQVTLGDMLRRQEQFGEAAKAYSDGIALIEAPEEQHWAVFYSRGIAYERSGQWPQAEADFRKALELSPDRPQVLNYLGYSYVEMQENLDEALAMIEKAVELSPESGFIVDSLGWVLYRLGRYDEAVAKMERAVELMPVDAIVTDHLGDVYWAVGRKLEARFQWRRALSFDPEEKELQRIRRKLEVGLDAVLNEEGAPPLAVSANDG
ncbi:MAG: tetratricopeptide repeat protein [Paracoccaceae bacterium]